MNDSFHCRRCGLTETWTTNEASLAAASWHFFEQHREVWLLIVGNRPPAHLAPEMLGLPVQERRHA